MLSIPETATYVEWS